MNALSELATMVSGVDRSVTLRLVPSCLYTLRLSSKDHFEVRLPKYYVEFYMSFVDPLRKSETLQAFVSVALV